MKNLCYLWKVQFVRVCSRINPHGLEQGWISRGPSWTIFKSLTPVRAPSSAVSVYEWSLASSQKGYKSLQCCCVRLKPLLPPFPKNTISCLLSCYTLPRIQGHTLHHPVREPPPANWEDLWGLAWFVKRWLPSRGVTATFVFQRCSQWCEETKKTHSGIKGCKILCFPSEQRSSHDSK